MTKLKITNMRNIYFGCAIIILSVLGILHTYIDGGWSKSTGEAAKMYPRLVYGIMIVVSLYLLIVEVLGKTNLEPPAITVVKWLQAPLIIILGIAFFMFALYIGVAVGLFIYLFVMISLFDENEKKNWKVNLVVALVAAVVLWLVFTKVLPVVTMQQILI